MEFKTQYDNRERVYCNPGQREHITYGGHYDENGRVVLEETGRINIYDEIQSHAESVDIHVLLDRYRRGDVDALSTAQGFYGDVLDFPKTYAEALNHMSEMEKQFMSLPLEVREKFGHSFSEFLASSNSPDFLDKLGIRSADPTPDPTPAKEADPE
uniref:Internal scaffolding protein n=1 Tax=Dulem virus 155 TaxID=3145632 RepID=A0AAU8AY56_9VIRU